MKNNYCNYIQIQTTDSLFDQALLLYNQSFPACERQSESLIIERIATEIHQLIAAIKDNELAAMSICRTISNSSFVLLDYLAVSPQFRGQSVGSQLLKNLTKKLTYENHLILEVEDPRYGKNREERIKRIQFYLKNGAVILNGVNYLLPPLDGGSPSPMWLMMAPCNKNAFLQKQTVVQLIDQLYCENYQQTDGQLLSIVSKNMPEIIKLSNQLNIDLNT